MVSAPVGMPIIWGADAKIGEREVTEALLRHDRLLMGNKQVILSDKDFASGDSEAFVRDEAGTYLNRPKRKAGHTSIPKNAI